MYSDGSLTETLHLVENLVGCLRPLERLALLVMGLDVLKNSAAQGSLPVAQDHLKTRCLIGTVKGSTSITCRVQSLEREPMHSSKPFILSCPKPKIFKATLNRPRMILPASFLMPQSAKEEPR